MWHGRNATQEKCMITLKDKRQLRRHGRRWNIKMDLKKTNEGVCWIHLA